MGILDREIYSKIYFCRMVEIGFSVDDKILESLKMIKKAIGGNKNKEVIKKAFEACAYNYFNQNKNIVEQIEYRSDKIEFFELLNKKEKSNYRSNDNKNPLYITIKLEFWKVAICFNAFDYIKTDQQLLDEIIKWNQKIAHNILCGEVVI